MREGVDCVLRFGNLPDSDLVARRVVTLTRLSCAAPAYPERFGTPTSIEALDGHRMIGLRLLTTGNLRPLEFVVAKNLRHVTLPATMSVTGTESYLATTRLALGLAQIPLFHGASDFERGTPRVRVFLDWAAREFAARGEASAPAQP